MVVWCATVLLFCLFLFGLCALLCCGFVLLSCMVCVWCFTGWLLFISAVCLGGLLFLMMLLTCCFDLILVCCCFWLCFGLF